MGSDDQGDSQLRRSHSRPRTSTEQCNTERWLCEEISGRRRRNRVIKHLKSGLFSPRRGWRSASLLPFHFMSKSLGVQMSLSPLGPSMVPALSLAFRACASVMPNTPLQLPELLFFTSRSVAAPLSMSGWLTGDDIHRRAERRLWKKWNHVVRWSCVWVGGRLCSRRRSASLGSGIETRVE